MRRDHVFLWWNHNITAAYLSNPNRMWLCHGVYTERAFDLSQAKV